MESARMWKELAEPPESTHLEGFGDGAAAVAAESRFTSTLTGAALLCWVQDNTPYKPHFPKTLSQHVNPPSC